MAFSAAEVQRRGVRGESHHHLLWNTALIPPSLQPTAASSPSAAFSPSSPFHRATAQGTCATRGLPAARGRSGLGGTCRTRSPPSDAASPPSASCHAAPAACKNSTITQGYYNTVRTGRPLSGRLNGPSRGRRSRSSGKALAWPRDPHPLSAGRRRITPRCRPAFMRHRNCLRGAARLPGRPLRPAARPRTGCARRVAPSHAPGGSPPCAG
jgi:hypothetical protein